MISFYSWIKEGVFFLFDGPFKNEMCSPEFLADYLRNTCTDKDLKYLRQSDFNGYLGRALFELCKNNYLIKIPPYLYGNGKYGCYKRFDMEDVLNIEHQFFGLHTPRIIKTND